jgi:L-fucose mutarotase/ribose pyranase (RbsD/FucU family)
MRWFLFLFLTALALFARPAMGANVASGSWQAIFLDRLPLYGHRNWIVIADSAYPAQSGEGIETIVSQADYFQVLQTVLTALESSKHVRPIVYTDRELAAVPESDAPGISVCREQLATLLKSMRPKVLPHEKIISTLGQTSQTFRVLIIKTNMTFPYTSVFLQLGCAYWSPEAERRLRSALATHSGR